MHLQVKMMDGYTLFEQIAKYARKNNWSDDELSQIRDIIYKAPELDLSMWNGWTVINNDLNSLPLNHGEYLVTVVDDWGIRRMEVSGFVRTNDDICSWSVEAQSACKVLAWMPLPEPYREEI